eukprot:TRINITY_DN19496_c0_g1_i1.p1 TRINITY_DN19496_c0_g1~~TRINITY_DN19496_c0_g1_i1.p1  ORF type:complete len:198 (+),score=39.76 TRINITY_DN19496_c0_g1_i1:82-675(+)
MLRRRFAASPLNMDTAADVTSDGSSSPSLPRRARRRPAASLTAAGRSDAPRRQGRRRWFLSLVASSFLFVGSRAVEEVTAPPPPEYSQAWQEFVDPTSGRSYWYNAETSISTWEKPGLPPVPEGEPPSTSEPPIPTTTMGPNYTDYALVIMCTVIGICVTCVTALFVVDCYCYHGKSAEEGDGEGDEEEGGGKEDES